MALAAIRRLFVYPLRVRHNAGSFFRSREGVLASDYIDIHTHVLPKFDDGAGNAGESLEILLQAWQAGFRTVAATPHMMAGVYEHDRVAVEDAIARLEPNMEKQVPGLKLVPGTEYYLDEHFYDWVAQGRLYPLGGGTHVLVELPMLKLPPMARDFAFRMQIKGYTPILAHPERYGDIMRKPQLIEPLVHAGYRIQINLGSLCDFYGRKVRKAALWLLKHDWVDFVGSDSHTPKQAAQVYVDGMEVLANCVGEAGMQRLLVDNPRAALQGEGDG